MGEVFWLFQPHFCPTQQCWEQMRVYVFEAGGNPRTYENGLEAFTSRKQGCLRDSHAKDTCYHQEGTRRCWYMQSLPEIQSPWTQWPETIYLAVI